MLIIKHLGTQPYETTLHAMQQFTESRKQDTADECWLLEHYPVYTMGKVQCEEHILQRTNIPVITSDRGGKITYHGPGQLIAYLLLDLKRKKVTPHQLVSHLENIIISLLTKQAINVKANSKARGVYVRDKKIASLGLRIRKGCSYHGLALNINMDLTPFNWINPCGQTKLRMTQLSDYIANATVENTRPKFIETLKTELGYHKIEIQPEITA